MHDSMFAGSTRLNGSVNRTVRAAAPTGLHRFREAAIVTWPLHCVTTASGASGRDPQPVAVRVFEIHLATGEALLVNRDAELLGDAVDVIDVEVDERVRSSVACVLRDVDSDRSS